MANLKNTTINETGFLQLPQGTTAQRPGSPQNGYIRFNTTLNNVEAYINGAWVEAGSSLLAVSDGLQIFLDADNTTSYPGSGTGWFDLSGANRNFTWNTTPSFNSSGIKYFSMSSRIATGPASNSMGITNSSGYTIQMFARVLSLTNNMAINFNNNSASRYGINVHLPWSDGNIYYDQGGCCAASQRTSVAWGGNTSTWYMWTFRRETNSSTRTIWRNTSIIQTNTNSASNPDLNTNGVRINGIVGATAQDGIWNAHLGAVLIYNRGLSNAEIEANFNAFRARYGI